MHKKLASELTSLAHSVLQMKNKENVFLLQKKAHEIYEKLSVLAYVEQYVNSTPQATQTKEELIAKIKEAENIRELKEQLAVVQNEVETTNLSEEKTSIIEELNQTEAPTKEVIDNVEEELLVETADEKLPQNTIEEITEQPFEELEEMMFGKEENEKFDETLFVEETKTPTLEDELKDTISVDVTADLFTKVEPRKSLNDRLQNTIQIGLNDRIAFVKHLFNGDPGDFNRVVSQLNTFNSEIEAKKFINKTVKPDYDWSNKEEYEARFLEIVERKFL